MYLPTRRFFFFFCVLKKKFLSKKEGGQENVQVGERPGLVRPQLRGFIVSVRHTSRMLPRKEAFVFFLPLLCSLALPPTPCGGKGGGKGGGKASWAKLRC